MLAAICGENGNYVEALKWFLVAEQSGNVAAVSEARSGVDQVVEEASKKEIVEGARMAINWIIENQKEPPVEK